eukprot:3347478-Pyramimonas_sp.AAC.1
MSTSWNTTSRYIIWRCSTSATAKDSAWVSPAKVDGTLRRSLQLRQPKSDVRTDLFSRTLLSAARAIQAPWVGSTGSPLSSSRSSNAPTPPISENDINAVRSGSSFRAVSPRDAVERR